MQGEPAASADAPPARPVPPPPKRRTGLWVGLGLGVLALLLIAGIFGSPAPMAHPSSSSSPPPPPSGGRTVRITSVNWKFSGASNCWSTLTTRGGKVPGGGSFDATIELNYTAGPLQPNRCTVQSASVGTTSFTYENANTPLEVASGGSQTLSVTVQVPDDNLSTVLTLDAQVTSP
jgi:hypothetical protein